ncbi:acetyltransferase component of pyruvate dehydrogenase complex [Novosphingobium marinum]|uniref:Acetyltransferase component of pyruvate dehydrogenase complex n=1 Tax=Novosphingobium marinum TaxID=1514948 RepID=A0A7Y9XW89_9SPHN|nr:pyruvate dehydrogenase complex dihydrolipoamide acetyltransferase [Novosphingobium marinum]NYH94243.1 pyruvate dehydrogenase E2 component (dihydrolipoamide acetyltransferase) [Novosphingobium marinum]GGC20798.1 acetyltransferase component of pyruvate dehydrogenase complex [Novosphingobium marinum]
MPIEIKMPALSPTMEEGKLAKWLVKEGDSVSAGDILAEVETDKATMEFEAVDEGTVARITVEEGTEHVLVGTTIAVIAGEDEDPEEAKSLEISEPAPQSPEPQKAEEKAADAAAPVEAEPSPEPVARSESEERIIASPLARRLAKEKGIDLATVSGSGPHGRIVKADIDSAKHGPEKADAAKSAGKAPDAAAPKIEIAQDTKALLDERVPHTVEKLSGMRKTIARRLAQSMQQAPHIYLTVDIQLDKLLALRSEINASLEPQGIKVSVNDMLIKALARALIDVPECNVTFAGDELIRYSRADISVAVSIPNGLITPIVSDASGRTVSSIAAAMKDLGQRAKEGKLQPDEYQGGTASISNMGMMGIKQFTAVINPPQSTILAIGAGEKRPWVMPDGDLSVATVMTATGSFDHRAVDGADGARLMAAFRNYVEAPLGMVV